VRRITEQDHQILAQAARDLPRERRARILPEERLEALALLADEESVRNLVREEKAGIIRERAEYLYGSVVKRNARLVHELRQLYSGQCQICQWDSLQRYGKHLSEMDLRIGEELSHRILSSSGNRVRKIILYGSRAQGTSTGDSDFDLLVVETDPVSKREEMQRLRQQFGDLSVPVDVWVMGEQEFEETKTIIGGLAYPAYKFGMVLSENP